MGFDYDAMIAKLCVWASDRPRAVERMRRALAEYEIRGLTTNLDFQRRLVDVEDFVRGEYDTGFIERHREALLGAGDVAVDERMAAAVLAVALSERSQRTGRSATASEHAASAGAGDNASAWLSAHRRQRLGF
jgi:acetyl/propionyl-CoA carboxylase alpha subunit